MQGIMITNGGPHPPEKWAAVSAAQVAALIDIDANSTSPQAAAARKAKPRFELGITEILETYHRNVQAHERAALEVKGEQRLLAPLDPHDGIIDTVEEVVAAIKQAAQAHPFGPHFQIEAVDAVIRKILARHAATSRDIERSWAADKNPNSEIAKAYHAARAEHGPHRVHEVCSDLRKRRK